MQKLRAGAYPGAFFDSGRGVRVGTISPDTARQAIRAYYNGTLGDPLKYKPRNTRSRSVITFEPRGHSPLERILPEHVTGAIETLDGNKQWIIHQRLKRRRGFGEMAHALELTEEQVHEMYAAALQDVAQFLDRSI